MHALKFTLFAFAICALINSAQAQSDDRYLISLTINGLTYEGSQQRSLRISGKSREAQVAILSEPLQRLPTARGFQLVVAVTDPAGVTTDYTGSLRLTYETFDCLTVTASGVMRVEPTRSCSGSDYPELWIIFNDTDGVSISVNEYQFTTLASPPS